MSFEMAEISVFACIKGYHAFKIKPCVGEECKLLRDHNNKFDKFAIGVYSNDLLIGHVPARPVPLSKCFWDMIESYSIMW